MASKKLSETASPPSEETAGPAPQKTIATGEVTIDGRRALVKVRNDQGDVEIHWLS